MRSVNCWVTSSFKEKLEKEAKRRGSSVSDLVRDLLQKELKAKGNIGTQRKGK
tara:strand:+ start:1048 stop:1206 length:159 start_codon:yes stop_codon:yes gene_type:complete